eukprot:7265491-Prymnesium_polylepis.1
MLLGGASGTIMLSESLSRVGSAAVAGARATTPAPTPAAPPPPLTPPPPPAAPPPPLTPPPPPGPSTPSYQEIRAAVAALSLDSPIKLVRETELRVQLGVKTNTGGVSRRCTRDV